jgi:hypothetical protein
MISKAIKATLRKASRKSVEDTYGHLKTHIKSKKWIGTTNRYRLKCTAALFKDTQPGKGVNSRNLAQYIAASAPLHCADGWSVLGRAIDSHSRGDFDASRHLAYYAELRAALSLLAAEGIGIFDDRHFIIKTPTDCAHIGSLPKAGRRSHLGTHYIAWAVLEHWSDLRRSAELLGKIVSAGGFSLVEWLSNFDTGPSFHPIGSRWLKTWGLDLRRLSDDREARNEASYRPSRLSSKNSVDALATSDFVHSMWALYEPSSHSAFEVLDRHLLRLTLEEAFEGTTGNSAQKDPVAFKEKVSAMLKGLGFEDARHKEWLNFLIRNLDSHDPTMLREAKQLTDIQDDRYHLQVISRAALLLRVATGGCGSLLRETGLRKDELKFWWAALGEDRGLWDSNEEPTEFTDLWADVEVALEGMGKWRTDNMASDPSMARWREERANDISILGGCERIALWGLDL